MNAPLSSPLGRREVRDGILIALGTAICSKAVEYAPYEIKQWQDRRKKAAKKRVQAQKRRITAVHQVKAADRG